MANLKELIVNGVSHFIGKVFINDSHITTINGVEVTENPKFTDTVTTVAYDSTNKKITKTVNGTTSDVVTAATLKTAMGLDNVEANQNAFSNVKIGSTTVAADSKTDTLELVAGSNVTLTPDTTNDKVTIASSDYSYIKTEGDNRNVATSPNDYTSSGGRANKLIFRGLKANPYINNPSSDTYSYLVGLRGWSDDSGGNAHELAFNNSGIYARNGSSSTWNDWEKIYTSGNLTYDGINPLQTKTYTNVIATANNEADGQLYCINVQPKKYGGLWSITYRVTATIAGVSEANGNGYETSVVYLSGVRDSYSSYRTWNDLTNGNYRPYYYHCFYRAKEAGITNGYGHMLGINLRYSYNPTTTANARTVKFEILSVTGCTVTFLDTPTKYANFSGTGTTNYNTYTNFDATTYGCTMTGDRNDVNYYNRNYYGCRKAAAPVYRYQLCVSKKDRSVLSISTVDNNVSTNKTLTTESFDPFGDILYWNSGATYAAGANVGDGWYNQYLADLRYSFNIGGNNTTSTLVGRKPLYLVTTLQSDGNVKLHSEPLAQDLPTTEDGLLYIYLGQIYPDTNPYRLYMSLHHPVYLFKNGHITNYTNNNDFVSVEQQPYSFRKSGGGVAVGDTEYDKIVGGTINWNQLAMFTANQIPSNANGITYAYTDGTSVKITGTATTTEQRTGWFGLSELENLPLSRLGHKVLVDMRVVGGSFSGNINYGIGASALRSIGTPYIGPLTNSNTNQLRFQHQIISGTVCNDLVVSINVFDLTAMFGPTIADYIYSLEQTTAGAGVAFFKSLFPNDYYPYNTGELLSVSGLSEHKMVGFNQFDKSTVLNGYIIDDANGDVKAVPTGKATDYISVIPKQTYYIKSDQASGAWGAWYDADKNYISGITGYYKDGGNAGKIHTAPADARYMRLTCFYNNSGDLNTFCVNISDAAKNGTYEPYKGYSYPLDSTLTLRGLFKLDANNNLYADGDTYDADGTVTRKYGIVDLGTLNWRRYQQDDIFIHIAEVTNMKTGSNYATQYDKLPLFGFPYTYKGVNTGWSSMPDDTFGLNGVQIRLRDDSYITAAAFKSAMSGVMLVYELATPTTEQATPYQNPQSVDEYGTEEYVSTSIIPIGHYTEYPASKTLIKNVTNNYNDIATQNKMGYMSASDKTKLDGIETGAEVNQNAFSNVKIGTTTISADTKTDTLELVAGSNITLTPDTTNDKITIAMTSSMLIQNITSNANLNTITTDGWYTASTDTIASSLSNCPSIKSFLMEVYHINSATGSNEVIYQKISTSENIHYERVKATGTWSEWKSSCYIDLNGAVYI